MAWPAVHGTPQVIAIVGDADNGCAASAADGRVLLIATAERWRRTRTAAMATAADVREAISQMLPADATIPPQILITPDLAAVAPPGAVTVSRTDAAIALARLYAGGPCLLLNEDGLTGAIELWDVSVGSGIRICQVDPPAADTIRAWCRAEHLDTLPASQIEALARWGGSPQALALGRLQQQLVDGMIGAVQGAGVPGDVPLVLVGRLFRNSFFSTALAAATPRTTLVPPDPGCGGLCVGVLAAAGHLTAVPSPFAGPTFDLTTTKHVLDSCKLVYQFPTDAETRAMVVAALVRGHLVAWFEGGMEWGPRALGHRSILADARNRYVLENLNVYLKKRPPFMSYGLAVRSADAADILMTARASTQMQFESRLRDQPALAHFVTQPAQPVRFQTVQVGTSGLADILDDFHNETGVPYLVNTSFNAISEPIVASPLDAVRCFYGSGLDLMVINGLVVTK
jgi:hypothetical protein